MTSLFLFGAAKKTDVSLTTSPGHVASPFLQAPKHANELVDFEDPKL